MFKFKDRARYKDSSYIIMVDSKERFEYEKDIWDFVEIENVLYTNTCKKYLTNYFND